MHARLRSQQRDLCRRTSTNASSRRSKAGNQFRPSIRFAGADSLDELGVGLQASRHRSGRQARGIDSEQMGCGAQNPQADLRLPEQPRESTAEYHACGRPPASRGDTLPATAYRASGNSRTPSPARTMQQAAEPVPVALRCKRSCKLALAPLLFDLGSSSGLITSGCESDQPAAAGSSSDRRRLRRADRLLATSTDFEASAPGLRVIFGSGSFSRLSSGISSISLVWTRAVPPSMNRSRRIAAPR